MPETSKSEDKEKDGSLGKTNLFRASIHACVEVRTIYLIYLTICITSCCAIVKLWTKAYFTYN